MSASVPTAHFLVGPTAVGKSAVAHLLARQTGWPVLSADSMNVYRGMDIGTAKPSPAERKEVRYFGVDLVDPDQAFSAGAYLDHAREVCAAEANLIVAGGTGLYIQALLQGLDSAPPNPEHRATVQALFDREGVQGLQRALRDRDEEALAALADPENPRRLMRALEQALAGRSGPGQWAEQGTGTGVVGLTLPRDPLRERIAARVEAMFAAGLVEEARGLAARFGSFSLTAGKGIGYAEALARARGDMTIEQAKQRTAQRTAQLAKRQRTWFRNRMTVSWVEVEDAASTEALAGRVQAAWDARGPVVCRGAVHAG